MIKRVLKKIIISLRLQQIAYFFFNLYAAAFRFQIVSRHNISYHIDLKEAIDRAIFLMGWEPLTINWLHDNLNKGDIVIEVGANIGAHSLIISKIISPEGQLFCFEPTDYAYEKLYKNFNLNPDLKQNTRLIKSFVSNQEGSKKSYKIRSSWIVNKTAALADSMDEDFSGEIINLDDFFIDLPKLNLIKIDVDGFDFKVLQGAKEIITLFKPTIFVELGEIDLNRNGDSVSDIIDLFTDIGYSGILENGEPIVSAEQLLISLEEVTHSNGIFTHNG